MNCNDFESQLDEQFAASRPTESRELAEHAAQCVECRSRWEGYRLLADSIVVWREQTPEADLIESVMAARQILDDCCDDSSENRGLAAVSGAARAACSAPAVAETRPRGAWHRGRMGNLPAIAGVAALLCVGMTIWLLREGPPAAQQAAILATAGNQGQAAADPATQKRERVASTSASAPGGADEPAPGSSAPPELAPYSSLVQMATSALSEATVLLMPGTTGSRMPALEPPGREPGTAAEAEGWIDGLQDQLRPVGRSLGNAFDFLWQAGQSMDG